MAIIHFDLFICLPPELRVQIWHHVLDDAFVKPVTFKYKSELWQPRSLAARLDFPHAPEHLPCENYRHDLSDPVYLRIPLFYVNREAREVVSAWVSKHEDIHQQSVGIASFTKTFNPDKDVLFIPSALVEDFCYNSCVQSVARNLDDDTSAVPETQVKHLAVPMPHLKDGRLFLTLEQEWNIDTLSLVFEPPPNLIQQSDTSLLLPHWSPKPLRRPLSRVELAAVHWVDLTLNRPASRNRITSKLVELVKLDLCLREDDYKLGEPF